MDENLSDYVFVPFVYLSLGITSNHVVRKKEPVVCSFDKRRSAYSSIERITI
jgi:hypothetical protein